MLTSNDKGNVAEAAIALEAIKLGIDVLKPLAEHGRYDLALDLGNACFEFSANGAPSTGSLASSACASADRGLPRTAYVTSTYSAEEVDAVAVYCAELKRSVPASDRSRRRQSGKSICDCDPPRNGQRAALTLQVITDSGL